MSRRLPDLRGAGRAGLAGLVAVTGLVLRIGLAWLGGSGSSVRAEELPPLAPAEFSVQGSKIANGVVAAAWPEVAQLSILDVAISGTQGFCTATFVGCRTAITAAHCVCLAGIGGNVRCPDGTDLIDPSRLQLFLPQGGIFPVHSVTVPQDYAFSVRGDIAVLALDAPLRRIRPRAINEGSEPGLGSSVHLLGFGGASEDIGSLGLLREGRAQISTCSSPLGSVPANAHVCWRFEPPLGAPGADSNTCPGDSGGPLLADLGAGLVLAGVHSGGFDTGCSQEDLSFDTDVAAESAFLRAQAGVDLDAQACGEGAQVGDAGVTTFSFAVQNAAADELRSFSVAPGTKLLRVALTGAANADYDLVVRAGSAPVQTQNGVLADCVSASPGSAEICEFADPLPGSWFAELRYFDGTASTLQLLATLLPEDPPPPAQAPRQVVVSNFTSFELMQVDLGTGQRAVASSVLRGRGPLLRDPEGLARAGDEAGEAVLVAIPFDRSVQRVDLRTGDRTLVSGCTDPACDPAGQVGSGPPLLGPRFVRREPAGTLLVADRSLPGSFAIVRVEPATGARTTVSGCANEACSVQVGAGPPIGRLFGLALEPAPAPPGAPPATPGAAGRLFAADGLAVFAIDLATGDRTRFSGCGEPTCAVPVGQGSAFGEPADVAIAADGALLVSYRVEGSAFGALRRIDAQTGDRTLVSGCLDLPCADVRGAGPRFVDPFGIEPDGPGALLVADSGLDALLRVDLVTGDRTLVTGCADSSCQSARGSGPRLAQPLDIAFVPEPAGAAGAATALGVLAGIAALYDRGGHRRAARRERVGRRRPRLDGLRRHGSDDLGEGPSSRLRVDRGGASDDREARARSRRRWL